MPKPAASPQGKSAEKGVKGSPTKGAKANGSKELEKTSTLPKINSPKANSPTKGSTPRKAKESMPEKMPSIDSPSPMLTEPCEEVSKSEFKMPDQVKSDEQGIAELPAQEATDVNKTEADGQAAIEAERLRVEAEELAKKQNGNITLKYEMYNEVFPIQNGSITSSVIDEAYCLSFVMPQCLIHLSIHEPAAKLALESQGQLDLFIRENPVGVFHGLEADQTYYVYIEQESDQLARDQARMREIAATMEGANSTNNGSKKDDGRGFESCSCIEGNPCVDEYGCKDWYNRYAIATKNGWKGF